MKELTAHDRYQERQRIAEEQHIQRAIQKTVQAELKKVAAHTAMPSEPEQEPVAWKLMPRDATDSMLKAMDECSTEGYDERLYAGHAASVYMAAWDEAPTPPQRTWVGLTDEEVEQVCVPLGAAMLSFTEVARAIEAKLMEKNA